MLIDNKTNGSSGRSSVLAGFILLGTGVALCLSGGFSFGGIVLLVGFLLVFTYNGVEINTETRKVRQYSKLFGLFKAGRWMSYDSYVGLTLIPMSTIEQTAGWSNKISTSKTVDYRIYFVNEEKKPAYAIKRCDSKEMAKLSLDEFLLWLKIPVYTIKKDNKPF